MRWGETHHRRFVKNPFGTEANLGRKKEIEALLKEGMSITEMADYLGMARSSLSEYMKRWGLRKR